ncbi:hypothetical protein Slin15195_G116800 [Septoria linicola]|uniref:Uncharacterized protein n=1 Tax=Septoria linicola TaxID=215465 RepID=A0A9Q9B8L1_9PEZI|nr:hypothetical protein Slin15195_G116800 [Septoria linicola]
MTPRPTSPPSSSSNSAQTKPPPPPRLQPNTTHRVQTLHIENLHITHIRQLEHILAHVNHIRIKNTYLDHPSTHPTSSSSSAEADPNDAAQADALAMIQKTDAEQSESAKEQSEADVMLVAEKLRNA